MSEDWRERKLNKLLEAAAPLKREDLEAILGKPLHPRDKSHIEWASKVVRDLPDGVSLQDAYEAGQALALDNLNRSDFELSERRDRFEWCRPLGGPVYSAQNEDGSGLVIWAVIHLGHMDPPCAKCLEPLDTMRRAGLCHGCNYIAEAIHERGDELIVVEDPTGRRLVLSDGGRRSVPDKSILGFSGREWNLEPVGDREPVSTNNMWCSVVHLSQAWFEDLPPTHQHEMSEEVTA